MKIKKQLSAYPILAVAGYIIGKVVGLNLTAFILILLVIIAILINKHGED